MLTIGTGLLFGLFPALHSTRPDLLPDAEGSVRPAVRRAGAAMFRTSLATFQIAISMTLLIAAGLFVKSLAKVSRVELGLKTDNVVTFGVSPRVERLYAGDGRRCCSRGSNRSLAAAPGVTGVTAAIVAVLAGNNWGTDVTVQGFQHGPDVDRTRASTWSVPITSSTLGIPLIAGREFTGRTPQSRRRWRSSTRRS